MNKSLNRNQQIKCLKCKQNFHQITEKHLVKCSNITVKQYKIEFPDAPLRTDWHIERIRQINKETKSGDNSAMKNPIHYNKMMENQIKAVQSDDYRKKVSIRQTLNNNNPHIFGPHNKSDINWKISDNGRMKLRKSIIEQRKLKGLSGFIPNYNKSACDIFDLISKRTNTKIQHGNNGGEYFISELYYWVDGYDADNNIVYEYDEPRHFNSKGDLREKDYIRQREIENILKCKFIRITEATHMDDIVNGFSKIDF